MLCSFQFVYINPVHIKWAAARGHTLPPSWQTYTEKRERKKQAHPLIILLYVLYLTFICRVKWECDPREGCQLDGATGWAARCITQWVIGSVAESHGYAFFKILARIPFPLAGESNPCHGVLCSKLKPREDFKVWGNVHQTSDFSAQSGDSSIDPKAMQNLMRPEN